MFRVNEHYLKLRAGYLFPEISRRVKAFTDAYPGDGPNARVIRMGIGDVTEPLPPACVEAMCDATAELGVRETFRGYGPEQGYDFLREAIATHDYRARGCDVSPDEVFVSDGSKCDTANLLDVLGEGNTVAVSDPVYPVYVDTNVMAGHTGGADDRGEYAGLVYLRTNAETGFLPPLPDRPVDVIYLCSPNNPTGTAMPRDALAKWVDYAREHRSLILFDAAYEAFIRDDGVPHSVYEIDGACDCAIEFRSFSKTAGFTGVRCAHTVVPESLRGRSGGGGETVDLHRLWTRRHTTKFNGVSYPVQRAAAAVYTEEGRRQVRERIDLYLANADAIRDGLSRSGWTVYGGRNAPYVWTRPPVSSADKPADSWQTFDRLLRDARVVCTPGSGFGRSGEGYVRLSAFNTPENVAEALDRIARL